MRMRWPLVVHGTGVLVGILLQGGAAQAKPLEPIPRAEAERRLDAFAHEPVRQTGSEETIFRALGCEVSRVTLNVKDRDAGAWVSVDVTFYYPKVSESLPSPGVLLVPTSSGIGAVEWYVAPRLCLSGMAVALPNVNTADTPIGKGLDEGVEDHADRLGVWKLRTVLDTFTTNRRVDPGRIGVFGASLGAITGSLVAAADPRIKASVLIVGSGNLSGMSTHTTLPKAVQLRRQRKRILKLRTDDQYNDWLRSKITLDPIHFAYRIPKNSVFMAMSSHDSLVPVEYQWELWRALGKPRYHAFSTGHQWTILRMIFLRLGEAVSFLADRFGMPFVSIPTPETPPGTELDEDYPSQEPSGNWASETGQGWPAPGR